MPQVKDLTQTRVAGIHVSMEPGGQVTREEAYFGFEMKWLGKPQEVDVIADRYMANYSDGNHLTEWRVTLRGAYASALTAASRKAADAWIEPMVLAWLHSPDYRKARQSAYASAVRRAISEERYNADRARRVFEMHRHELSADDAARLNAACNLLAQLLEMLKETQ